MSLVGNYQQASFRGVPFFVDAANRAGGRRLVPHEFPKRDVPYTEDMGRKGRAIAVTGYLIGPGYKVGRDALIAALEQEGPATLIHPWQGAFQVNAGPYSCVERRERGLFCEIEMQFLEAGSKTGTTPLDDTIGAVRAKASEAGAAAARALNTRLARV